MEKVTVDAKNKLDAIAICAETYGWTPGAVREVDSGDVSTRAWICFESEQDAMLWDNQR